MFSLLPSARWYTAPGLACVCVVCFVVLTDGHCHHHCHANVVSAKEVPADSKAEAKLPDGPRADAKKAASKADDDSEEEEEEDDDVADLQVKPVSQANSSKERRRISVSAESVDPAKLMAQRANVVSVEKTPDVAARLMAVVSKSPMLRTLDADQKEMIIKAFTGPVVKQPGDDIIVQGDIGDVFYLLEDGNVDVYIRRGGGDEIKVHTYKPGDGFGELAIMYNAPRAATCRAQTEAKLWALDRNSFRVIVVAAAMIRRETYQGFLAKVPILQTLTEMEIMTLADSLAEEKYEDGHVICKQGDEGEYFYIIKEVRLAGILRIRPFSVSHPSRFLLPCAWLVQGAAVCTQVDADGNDKVVAKLTSGNYFGEIALLTTKPRQATVKAAEGQLCVLAIDRATFIRVFGNLDELMKRNMEVRRPSLRPLTWSFLNTASSLLTTVHFGGNTTCLHTTGVQQICGGKHLNTPESDGSHSSCRRCRRIPEEIDAPTVWSFSLINVCVCSSIFWC